MRNSWLPKAKPNLFQGIRAKRSQLLDQGMNLIDLSIGEPRGPALLSARQAAAEKESKVPDAGDRITFNDIGDHQFTRGCLIAIGDGDRAASRGVTQVAQVSSVEGQGCQD